MWHYAERLALEVSTRCSGPRSTRRSSKPAWPSIRPLCDWQGTNLWLKWWPSDAAVHTEDFQFPVRSGRWALSHRTIGRYELVRLRIPEHRTTGRLQGEHQRRRQGEADPVLL